MKSIEVVDQAVREKHEKKAKSLVEASKSTGGGEWLNIDYLNLLLFPKEDFKSICRNIAASNIIKKLNLSGCNIEKLPIEQCQQLFGAIKENQSIEDIYLHNVQLEDMPKECWDLFVDAITRNKNRKITEIQHPYFYPFGHPTRPHEPDFHLSGIHAIYRTLKRNLERYEAAALAAKNKPELSSNATGKKSTFFPTENNSPIKTEGALKAISSPESTLNGHTPVKTNQTQPVVNGNRSPTKRP